MQVCGLKLVESQLLASLAAANARSDAATLRAQRLAAALETATAKLASASSTASAAGVPGAAVGGGAVDGATLAAEVSQLQAQLLARSQEVYELQDQLMQAKQVCSARGFCGSGLWVDVGAQGGGDQRVVELQDQLMQAKQGMFDSIGSCLQQGQGGAPVRNKELHKLQRPAGATPTQLYFKSVNGRLQPTC